MDDLKIVFWIILGLIYIFARKKKTAVPPPSRTPSRELEREEEAQSPSSPGPKSFEELLREIQEMKTPAAEPTPVVTIDRPPVKREPEYVDYDDEIEEENTNTEKPYDYYSQDKIYQVYDDAKKQAFERPSLEETIKLEDTIVRFKQFKGYEKEKKQDIGGAIMKDLKDPDGFKKAFLLSEILNRKY